MDFIERLFGIAPDGGNGSLEALYVTLAIVVFALAMLGLRYRRDLPRQISAVWAQITRKR